MLIGITANEQHDLNTCYADFKMALDRLTQIQHKDSVLIHVQRQLYGIEDTLHQYVRPAKKEVE